MGQDAYLPRGTELTRRPYRLYRDGWDHDHCEFCSATLVESTSPAAEREHVVTEGFATTDRHSKGADYYWVCESCFRDFADEFGWTEVPAP